MSQNGTYRHVDINKNIKFILSCKKFKIMKTAEMKNLTFEKSLDMFNEFTLSIEEMTYVRGGEDEGDVKPGNDPVKI